MGLKLTIEVTGRDRDTLDFNLAMALNQIAQGLTEDGCWSADGHWQLVFEDDHATPVERPDQNASGPTGG